MTQIDRAKLVKVTLKTERQAHTNSSDSRYFLIMIIHTSEENSRRFDWIVKRSEEERLMLHLTRY